MTLAVPATIFDDSDQYGTRASADYSLAEANPKHNASVCHRASVKWPQKVVQISGNGDMALAAQLTETALETVFHETLCVCVYEL